MDHKDTGKIVAMSTNIKDIQSVDYDCGNCMNCINGVKTLNMNSMTYVGACGARATYTFGGSCWNCGEKGHRNGECSKPAETCNKCKGAHRTDLHDVVFKSRGSYMASKNNYNNKNDYKSNNNNQSMHNKLKTLPKAYLSHIDTSVTDGDMQQWAISDAFDMYREAIEEDNDDQTAINIIDLNTNLKINGDIIDLAKMKKLAGIEDENLTDVNEIEYNLEQYKRYKQIKENDVTGCQRFANLICDIANGMTSWLRTPEPIIDLDELDDYNDIMLRPKSLTEKN